VDSNTPEYPVAAISHDHSRCARPRNRFVQRASKLTGAQLCPGSALWLAPEPSSDTQASGARRVGSVGVPISPEAPGSALYTYRGAVFAALARSVHYRDCDRRPGGHTTVALSWRDATLRPLREFMANSSERGGVSLERGSHPLEAVNSQQLRVTQCVFVAVPMDAAIGHPAGPTGVAIGTQPSLLALEAE
jgi:hypothetical protein